jgi:hypothetical protein
MTIGVLTVVLSALPRFPALGQACQVDAKEELITRSRTDRTDAGSSRAVALYAHTPRRLTYSLMPVSFAQRAQIKNFWRANQAGLFVVQFCLDEGPGQVPIDLAVSFSQPPEFDLLNPYERTFACRLVVEEYQGRTTF